MKKYSLQKVRSKTTYSYTEVCSLLKVTPQTVSKWVNEGLELIDPNEIPRLIMGADLNAFLSKRYEAKKIKLQSDEVFCVACKKAVKVKDGTKQIRETGKKIGRTNQSIKRIVGECNECGHEISRLFK